MSNPAPDDLLLIGEVVAAFGIRGQLKVRSLTDQVAHLQHSVTQVYVGPKRVPYPVVSLFEHKPGLLIVALQGITTRTQAEELRGAELAIPEQDAAPLADDEYYLHQLYGLRVETAGGDIIGLVREVLQTGANEVLVVTRDGQPDALIPMIRDVVAQLDIAGGKVVITPIDGLLP